MAESSPTAAIHFSECHLIERLGSYSWLKNGYDTAFNFYQGAKDSNRYLQAGFSLAEENLNKVKHSTYFETVCGLSEPWVLKADQLACKGLDKFDESITSGGTNVKENVVGPLMTTWQNVMAVPALCLDRVEDTLNYFLPPDKDEGASKGTITGEGFSFERAQAIGIQLKNRGKKKLIATSEDLRARMRGLVAFLVLLLEYLKTSNPEKKEQLMITVKSGREELRLWFVRCARAVVQPLVVRPLVRLLRLVPLRWRLWVADRLKGRVPFICEFMSVSASDTTAEGTTAPPHKKME